jgi:hypothetical protein
MNHSQILRAYLGAIPQSQMEAIARAEARAWQAAMNEGSRSQIAAGAAVDAAIAGAIASILPSDLERIERIIAA